MFQLFSHCFGVDLGTANTLVVEKGRGIVLNEPSMVAVRPSDRSVLAVGESAKYMLGKTPGDIITIRPMQNGVIANFEITEIMLRYFIRKIMNQGFSFFKNPKLILCIPSDVTEVEKRAVEEAARAAGAKETYLMEEPVAAAMGLGLDVSRPQGHMILDIGGGTSEAAVISLNGVVTHQTLRVGGVAMDHKISEYVREQYRVSIGEATSEYLKIALGNVYSPGKEQAVVRGRSLVSGLPATISVSQEEIAQALSPSVARIQEAVVRTLEQTPPELVGDIDEEGIFLTGGGSLVGGLDVALQERTGIRILRAGEPFLSVALGAGKMMDAVFPSGFLQKQQELADQKM